MFPRRREEKLDDSLFQNPATEYRAVPFWSWNNKLEKSQLHRQLEYFKQMGMGGAQIHSREGLNTEYLGEEFMCMVKASITKAQEEGLFIWLYDEDRWPSGSAGGLVTKNGNYRMQYILFTPYAKDVVCEAYLEKCTTILSRTCRSNDGELLARFDIFLNTDGYLEHYRMLEEGEEAKGALWYAYVEFTPCLPWHNNSYYADVLNEEAVRTFIQITHERYKEAIGDTFGTTVPAIFTDEPQYSVKTTLGFASEKKDVFFPWTEGFTEGFANEYNNSNLIAHLPELVWELADGSRSVFRYRYHDYLANRFTNIFMKQCGDWCKQNGILFTGHMRSETYLYDQTMFMGDVMRSYREFDLPGVDILCDGKEYNSLKQAQSVARQYGRPGIISEMYGVTNWDFDFQGHKTQGDWQAALGVVVRVPHLAWVSMEGNGKRDFPASIGYQSPWHKEYRVIEDHFARIGTALTRGKPLVKIGVIHPVESFWLHWGPNDQTGEQRKEMEERFGTLTQWLLFELQDFDFICEKLLPSQCLKPGAPLEVGEMAYEVIIIPPIHTIRKSTVEILEAFKSAGGRLIFMDHPPLLMDAQKSEETHRLAEGAKMIPFSRASLMRELESVRMLDIRCADGKLNSGERTENLLYQMRQDGDIRWLFLCQARDTQSMDPAQDQEGSQELLIELRGEYVPVLYNTSNGSIVPLPADYTNGKTYLKTSLYRCDSLLLQLNPGRSNTVIPISVITRKKVNWLNRSVVDITLEEPNVLLLDLANYRYNEQEPWREKDEILRIDDNFRKHLGYPLQTKSITQPWTIRDEGEPRILMLLFSVESDIALEDLKLAGEHLEETIIFCNGNRVTSSINGWYVDEDIKTVSLPGLHQGHNEIEVHVPITLKKRAESYYLLGDFGVMVQGTQATITPPVKQLGFGNVVCQGLPFYSGNIIYHLPVQNLEECEISVPHYVGALVKVSVDHFDEGYIIYPPYNLKLNRFASYTKTIDITLYGNRFNTFGALHNANTKGKWWSPQMWRRTGDAWSYEYNLKPFGILAEPDIYSWAEI